VNATSAVGDKARTRVRARMRNRKVYQAKIHAADGRAVFIARVRVISSREKEPAIFIFLARRGQGKGAS